MYVGNRLHLIIHVEEATHSMVSGTVLHWSLGNYMVPGMEPGLPHTDKCHNLLNHLPPPPFQTVIAIINNFDCSCLS